MNLKSKVSITGAVAFFVACVVLIGGGCGTSIFSPAFVNQVSGGSFPLTPGPGAAFVLVRGVNDTGQTAEFIVTIDRLVIETDENGNFLFDQETGEPITREERETKRLLTQPAGLGNDLGVLFECGQFPVIRIGLGEDLLPTDAAVFVGGSGGLAGRRGSAFPRAT